MVYNNLLHLWCWQNFSFRRTFITAGLTASHLIDSSANNKEKCEDMPTINSEYNKKVNFSSSLKGRLTLHLLRHGCKTKGVTQMRLDCKDVRTFFHDDFSFTQTPGQLLQVKPKLPGSMYAIFGIKPALFIGD